MEKEKKLLVVTDMQYDFIGGALGINEELWGRDFKKDLVARVASKINYYLDNGWYVIFTQDTHQDDYMDTREGRNLPTPHCIEGSHGWHIHKTLRDAVTLRGRELITCEKPTFGGEELSRYYRIATMPYYDTIEFVGLCTGICVLANAVYAKMLCYERTEIVVDASCCACVTPETHETALRAMKMQQITVTNEDYRVKFIGDKIEEFIATSTPENDMKSRLEFSGREATEDFINEVLSEIGYEYDKWLDSDGYIESMYYTKEDSTIRLYVIFDSEYPRTVEIFTEDYGKYYYQY